MTNPEEIVETIQKMKYKHEANGGKPEKITMHSETYYSMLASCKEVMAVEIEKVPHATICGLLMEVRNDMDKDVLFIVS